MLALPSARSARPAPAAVRRHRRRLRRRRRRSIGGMLALWLRFRDDAWQSPTARWMPEGRQDADGRRPT